ncbi:MAG: NAD(+)/NADH kinase [Candidatus Limnocylindrales bacterium]
MKRLGLAYNPTNDAALVLKDRAADWCRKHKVDAWDAPAGELETLVAELPKTDGLIVLGGDGTFLRAARAVAAIDVPILGINSGTVGFLSKAEPRELEEVLAHVAAGDYDLEARMMLEARVLPDGQKHAGESHVALNDAAIVRGSQARVVRLEVTVDGTHLATYICDGLVVSTPTGSTGYSFSAGGPILDPTSRNMVMTTIAAYLSAIRSIVVGPDHTVLVKVIDAYDVLVSIDGREDIALKVGDAVEVVSRDRPIRFITPHGSPPFWELLRRKAELLPS